MIQFEDWVDTGEEYTTLDEVAKDRDGRGLAVRPASVVSETSIGGAARSVW